MTRQTLMPVGRVGLRREGLQVGHFRDPVGEARVNPSPEAVGRERVPNHFPVVMERTCLVVQREIADRGADSQQRAQFIRPLLHGLGIPFVRVRLAVGQQLQKLRVDELHVRPRTKVEQRLVAQHHKVRVDDAALFELHRIDGGVLMVFGVDEDRVAIVQVIVIFQVRHDAGRSG